MTISSEPPLGSRQLSILKTSLKETFTYFRPQQEYDTGHLKITRCFPLWWPRYQFLLECVFVLLKCIGNLV